MKKSCGIISLLLCLLLATGLCACTHGKSGNATLAVTSYAYSTESAEDLAITFAWNGASFTKLTRNDEDVAGENYALDGNVLTLYKSYLDGLGGGVHVFVVVTDRGNVSFTVTVTVPQGEKLPTIDDLIGSDYYHVTIGEGNGLTKLPTLADASPDSDIYKYLRFKEGNRPLEVGESFTCNFGTDDFYEMRLRPYNDLLRPNSFREEGTAAYRYVTDENGTGLMAKGDNYYGADTIKLKGSAFVLGATYSVSVTFATTGSGGQLRFYTQNVVSLSGTEMQTKTNTFTVPENLVLVGDHTWYYDCLLLDISAGATVTVYSLTLTRTA